MPSSPQPPYSSSTTFASQPPIHLTSSTTATHYTTSLDTIIPSADFFSPHSSSTQVDIERRPNYLPSTPIARSLKRNRIPSSSNLSKRSRRRLAPPSPSPSSSALSGSSFPSPRSPLLSPTFSGFPAFLSPHLPTPSRLAKTRAPVTSSYLQATTSDMMSRTPLQPHFLSAKLEVSFYNEGNVDMIGGPNTGTSYSLPGQVSIVLPSLPAVLDGRVREIRDLKVVMEGKSEFYDEEGRYTPMRLHSSTLTLASFTAPLLVPAQDPSRPRSSLVHLSVPFDLRLPGWLPSSHTSPMTKTTYGAHVEMTLQWFDNPGGPGSAGRKHLFANSSSQSLAITSSCSKFTPFTIRRHRFPVATDGYSLERPERHYTLRPDNTSASPVECIVTVPEWVDVYGEERSLKVSLRLRARRVASSPLSVDVVDGEGEGGVNELQQPDMGEYPSGTSMSAMNDDDPSSLLRSVPMERQQPAYRTPQVKATRPDDILTHMVELGMEIEEVERYSSCPNPSFTASFPLPAEQPSRTSDRHALISPRSAYADSILGTPNDARPYKAIRTRQCLLADDGNQRNFFFVDSGLGLGDKWRKVNVVLPMPELGKDGEFSHGGRPQPEMDGPFLRVKHNLKTRVVCRNAGSENQDTVVILSTPIRFGTCPTTMPGISPANPLLPAYIQLFHENGDLRECEPLPLYSKTEVDEAASTAIVHNVTSPIPSLPDYKALYPDAMTPYSSRSPSPSESSSSLSPSLAPSPSESSGLSRQDSMDIDSPMIRADDATLSSSSWGIPPEFVTPPTMNKIRASRSSRTIV